MTKMLLAPRIPEKGVPGFLVWARRDSPALYASLVRAFPEVADFERQNGAGLNGLFDSLASAAGKIGTFVKNNALPILAAAAPVLIAKKQADVAIAQMRVAVAQEAPLQTALTAPGGYVLPVPVQRSGVSAVPSWAWIAGAGVAVLSVVLLASRR